MANSSSLDGKVAFVSGSSKGIGAAIAVELARSDYRLILHGSKPTDALEQTRQQLDDMGCDARCCTCDFADVDLLEDFAELAWSQYNRIDVVVNNAGGDVLTDSKADWNAEQKLDYLFQIDCRATFQLSRLLGIRMKKTASGNGVRSIINIGWDQAIQGMEGDSGEIFSTIKGGIMSMTLSLAQSLAPEVRVNCVAPGWIQTQWGERASDYWQQRATSESLMQRWGTPADVANAVSFLASEKASFISGLLLPVNGGFRYNQSS